MRPSACLVCGGSYLRSRLPGLVVCDGCRFVTADIAVSGAELEALYGANYFAGEEYHDYIAERRVIERNFRTRLKTLLAYVPDASRRRLFEIGSAYGFFLSVAQPHFSAVEGIDISRDAVAYAAGQLGLTVHAGDFLEHTLSNPIDVACLWDTIEHLQSPDLYIEKLAAHTSPGAIVALTTGDIGSLVARLRGPKWRQIHPPTHLHYFSRDTIGRLLRRHGFKVRSCEYVGMHRSLDTMAYIVLNIKHNWAGLYRSLKGTGLLRWDIYLNLRDIMFVVAEKT
jgi:hypothetical protein